MALLQLGFPYHGVKLECLHISSNVRLASAPLGRTILASYCVLEEQLGAQLQLEFAPSDDDEAFFFSIRALFSFLALVAVFCMYYRSAFPIASLSLAFLSSLSAGLSLPDGTATSSNLRFSPALCIEPREGGSQDITSQPLNAGIEAYFVPLCLCSTAATTKKQHLDRVPAQKGAS